MKYYSIGEFSNLIGKTPQTLRDWHKKGIFIPSHITEGKRANKAKKMIRELLQDDA